ncbi:hypothetical protein EV715DRAFT_259765 [Schizophyllum commune]
MSAIQGSPNTGTRVTMKPRIAIREKPHRFQLSPLREVPAVKTPLNRAHIPTRSAFRDKTNTALRALAQNTPRSQVGDVKAPFLKSSTRPQPTRTRASSVSRTPTSASKANSTSRKASISQGSNAHTRSKTSPSPFSPSNTKPTQRSSVQTPKRPANKLVGNRRDTFSPSYNTVLASAKTDTPSAPKYDVRGAALIARATQMMQQSMPDPPKLPASRKALVDRQTRSAFSVYHDNSMSSDTAAFGSPTSALRRSTNIDPTPQSSRLARSPSAFGHTWKALSIDTPTKRPQTPSRIPRSRRNLSLESALNFPLALDDSTVCLAFDLEPDCGIGGEDMTPISRGALLHAWNAGVRPATPSMHSQSSDSILDLVSKRASGTGFVAGGAIVDDFLARLKNGVEGKLLRPGFKPEVVCKTAARNIDPSTKSATFEASPARSKAKYASVSAVRPGSGNDVAGDVVPSKTDARQSMKRHAIYTRSLHMPNFRGFSEGEGLKQRSRAGTTGQTFSSSQRQVQLSPDAKALYESSKAGRAANIADRSLLLEPFSLDSAMGSQASLSSMYSQTSIANTLFNHTSTPLGTHRSAYSLDSISCVADLSHSVSGKLSTLGSSAGSCDNISRKLRSTLPVQGGLPPTTSASSSASTNEDSDADVFGTPTISQTATRLADEHQSMAFAYPPLSIAIVPPTDPISDASSNESLCSLATSSDFLRPDRRSFTSATLSLPRTRRMSSLNVQVKMSPAQLAPNLGIKAGHHPIIVELLEEVDRDLMSWMQMQVEATIFEYGAAF